MNTAATMASARSLLLIGIGTPLLLVAMLAMMVLPLPPFLLDMFFTFNISLSLVVLLVVVYTRRPLDFDVFPTVLLVATLLRLALNVASTRVVLLEGHTGTGAAGNVIQSFGEFVVGGNYVSAWSCLACWQSSILSWSPRVRAAFPKSMRVSPSTPCPVNRWLSMPI